MNKNLYKLFYRDYYGQVNFFSKWATVNPSTPPAEFLVRTALHAFCNAWRVVKDWNRLFITNCFLEKYDDFTLLIVAHIPHSFLLLSHYLAIS